MKVRSSLGDAVWCLAILVTPGRTRRGQPSSLGPSSPERSRPARVRWRPWVLALLTLALAAGCAGARRDPPLPIMTAIAHEQAAEAEERRAVQAAQVSAPEVGALAAEAARHRQVAGALRHAAAVACPAPALESEGVFSLVTAVILDVQALEEPTVTGPPRPSRARPPARIAGAVVRVSTRLPMEDAVAGLECQVARAGVAGGNAADPSAVPGVLHHVTSPTPGVLRVEVHTDEEVAALEVLRRARALAAH